MNKIFKKIKSKKGGSAFVIILVAIFIVFCGTFPSIIDSSVMRLSSEKLKAHTYRAANSAVLKMQKIKSDGNIDYDIAGTEEAMKNYFESLFGEPFFLTTTPISETNYYSATYRNSNNTKTFQYIFYQGATGTMEPTPSVISPSIKTSSEGRNLDVSKVLNTVDIKKPTVIIICRCDIYSQMFHKKESLIRFSASQINSNSLK